MSERLISNKSLSTSRTQRATNSAATKAQNRPQKRMSHRVAGNNLATRKMVQMKKVTTQTSMTGMTTRWTCRQKKESKSTRVRYQKMSWKDTGDL